MKHTLIAVMVVYLRIVCWKSFKNTISVPLRMGVSPLGAFSAALWQLSDAGGDDREVLVSCRTVQISSVFHQSWPGSTPSIPCSAAV